MAGSCGIPDRGQEAASPREASRGLSLQGILGGTGIPTKPEPSPLFPVDSRGNTQNTLNLRKHAPGPTWPLCNLATEHSAVFWN